MAMKGDINYKFNFETVRYVDAKKFGKMIFKSTYQAKYYLEYFRYMGMLELLNPKGSHGGTKRNRYAVREVDNFKLHVDLIRDGEFNMRGWHRVGMWRNGSGKE